MPTQNSNSSSAKKESTRKPTRKYGPRVSASVERETKAFKKGKLKSGSGRKVTSSKQAVAIGLSEARKAGAKVPKKSES